MQATSAYLPQLGTFGDRALIHPACAHFSIQMEDAEHVVFVQHFKRKVMEQRPRTIEITKKENFSSLTEVLDACPSYILPTMNHLLWAVLTLDMTTWTVERLFSAVNRMKTRTRAMMLTERLNSLSLLSFERESTESLEHNQILAAVFCCKAQRLWSYLLLT